MTATSHLITGLVTHVPPFYAPDGIDLTVAGRGGSDALQVSNGANVNLFSDPGLLTISTTGTGTVTDEHTAPTTSTNPAPTGLPAANAPTYTITSTASGTDVFSLST